MEKIITFKHGVSVNGELQVYKVTKYMDGDEVVYEITDKPYSPKDVQKMGDFDVRSQQIVEAIYKPEIVEEVQAEIAHCFEDLQKSGLLEIVRHDRMLDDLARIPIRRMSMLVENGKVISKKYHRGWIMPGGTSSDKDILSKTLAETFHTPENIEIFQDAMVENNSAFVDSLSGEKIII